MRDTPVRVLLIEDNPGDARLFQEMLAGVLVPRFSLCYEERLDHALRRLAGEPFDVIVSDLTLPDAQGLEAVARLRPQSSLVPLVVLTSLDNQDLALDALRQGAQDYLVKPFRSEQLCSTIEMALCKHRIDQQLKESELRYRMVSDLTSDFAYSVRVEPDGSLVTEWITDAHTRITGYTPSEGMATGSWENLVHADDLPTALELWQTVLAGQTDVRDYRIVRKDGEVRWLRNHARPVWDEDQGRIVRIYAAAQDVTEQRQAREDRERLILELQDALSKVKTLKGLLPMCASCKNIRNDQGYWTSVEAYIHQHSDAEFTHGLCPDCARTQFPDIFQ